MAARGPVVNVAIIIFGESWNGKMLTYFDVIWYILWQFGIFYGNLVYFGAIWYILWKFGIFCCHLVDFGVIWFILWSFGIYFPILGFCPKRNMATLATG
jgi:hypothetical protein